MGIYDGQAITSRRIRFIGGSLGFEDRVDDACNQIIDETYKYLYEQKRGEVQELKDSSQMDIDDKPPEDVQSDS